MPVPSSVTRPARLADVDDAELAPLEERLARGGRRLGLVRQAQRAASPAIAPPMTKRS